MQILLLNRASLWLKNKLAIVVMLILGTITPPVMAEEASAEISPSMPESTQISVDGPGATPQVRTIVKPNRSQMKASVINTKSGFVFLIDNASKPGVVKLKSGLQYRVIKAGSGARPKAEDVVKCQYKGALTDGTVFEQSEAGTPANIKVAPLVPGLKEAMMLMQVGSKWEVYIPGELGFGAEGKPPKVGPDAVLIYNLELLEIKRPASSKP